MPKATFYLLKADYTLKAVDFWSHKCKTMVYKVHEQFLVPTVNTPKPTYSVTLYAPYTRLQTDIPRSCRIFDMNSRDPSFRSLADLVESHLP